MHFCTHMTGDYHFCSEQSTVIIIHLHEYYPEIELGTLTIVLDVVFFQVFFHCGIQLQARGLSRL